MEGLLDDESLLHTSLQGMMRIVLGAFRKLFASAGPTAAWMEAWQRVKGKIVPKVSEHQRRLLEKPLSEAEITDALWALPGGKSPGHDGFPPDFYSAILEGTAHLGVCCRPGHLE